MLIKEPEVGTVGNKKMKGHFYLVFYSQTPLQLRIKVLLLDITIA